MASIALPRALRFAFTATLSALLAGACATGSKVTDDGLGGGGGGTSNPDPTGTEVCRLHSCGTDSECGGCEGGKKLCLVAEHRCVACIPGAGGCAEGEYCSPGGACVPTGQTCAVDAGGKPTITCGSSVDCQACDSLHQICDPASGACVTCTDADTSACATAACNAHRCAECSPTVACPAGNTCSVAGVCAPGDTTTGNGGVGGVGGGGGAVGAGGAGAGGGSAGACHDVCQSGAAMDKSCDPCATTLCAADAFCCTTIWDEQCVSEVGQYCGQMCSGTAGAGGGTAGAGGANGSGGGGGVGSGSGTCAHDVCTAGPALVPFCSDCALAVCGKDAFCCILTWDAQCVTEVAQYCPSGC